MNRSRSRRTTRMRGMRVLRLAALFAGLLLAVVVVAILLGFASTLILRLLTGPQDQLTEALLVGFLGGVVPTIIMIFFVRNREQGQRR